ncbi:MAG: amino acid permease [Candidatus Riflebacteria bacterium]|nr:amino acid permease [Candidatus Riflebacteria bacterium]
MGTTIQSGQSSVKFGTFAGVFTPSILTIFGVIMFMRANYVVGEAGILNALIILFLSQFITVLTTLSIGAIATSMPVKGGGAYFIVSRVLGAEFGGAIGIALFAAQIISISFYILGFAEAFTKAFPATADYFMYVGIGAALILFLIAYAGADGAIKTQYVIMVVLFMSIFCYLLGSAQSFSVSRFVENFAPAKGGVDFWTLFAIYFPSVTGFIAGINMSGDLKNPGESMTKGTLYSLLVASLVYFAQIIVFGGGFERQTLIDAPFQVMVNNSLFGAGFMVVLGVFSATLSSTLGRFVGAPRVLQAIARDEILPFLKIFTKGYGKSDEPRAGLILCFVVTIIMLLVGGDGSGGNFLNTVAEIMGMFFLYTFGLLNMAAFIELYSANPSFRPKYKKFHWSLALLGVILSFGAAILVDATSATIAFIVLCLLIWYLRRRDMKMSFGDARRGYLYTKIRKSLFDLQFMPEDTRNWRPSIMVLSGNPNTRETLVSYATWLNANKGIVVLANILVGKQAQLSGQREAAIRQMYGFLIEKNIKAFPHVVIANSILSGIEILLRGSAYSPLRPNILACGWKGPFNGLQDYISFLNEATVLNISQVLIADKGHPDKTGEKQIDLWWRGRKNGPLMLMLAHLLVLNWEWSGDKIVVKRVIENEAGKEPALKALQSLIDEARVEAKAEIVVSNSPFVEILHSNSKDADCVFLGFELPDESNSEKWYNAYEGMLKDMPTTILVHSTDSKDYLASGG